MSEMIETVARAIGDEPIGASSIREALTKLAKTVPGIDPVSVTSGALHAVARAAIEAMREPTAAMLDAACEEVSDGRVWSAMITAALTGGEE